jgi:hypothetical protein
MVFKALIINDLGYFTLINNDFHVLTHKKRASVLHLLFFIIRKINSTII